MMYCLQWLLPFLLIPKPVNPALLSNHVMLMALYITGFFLEHKPCTICTILFIAAVFMICSSSGKNCPFFTSQCDETVYEISVDMKINERTLIAHSTSTATPVDKEGWLWKRGDVNKSFQRRYFVLKGNLLFYFERRGEKEPIGVIILEGCTIELAEEEQEKLAFKIIFHGEGKRTYIIGTESQETLEEWMKILASASYDYMKLMVLELQQQLADLEEAEKSSGQQITSSISPNTEDGEQAPKAPPRQRINPFNNLSTHSARVVKTWHTLHEEMGKKILLDRREWCRKHCDLIA